MTDNAPSETLDRLLRSAVLMVAEDVQFLRSAHRRLNAALAIEAHEAIREHDADVRFWLRGAALRCAQHALAEGDKSTAAQMLRWADKGVPMAERSRMIEVLIQ